MLLRLDTPYNIDYRFADIKIGLFKMEMMDVPKRFLLNFIPIMVARNTPGMLPMLPICVAMTGGLMKHERKKDRPAVHSHGFADHDMFSAPGKERYSTHSGLFSRIP